MLDMLKTRKLRKFTGKTPLYLGVGGGPKPQEDKKSPNPAFLRCFLVLQKIPKRAASPHLKRQGCELFGARGPKERHFACIFTGFSCF